MTQEELDKLPEFKPFSSIEKIIDGRRVLIPVANRCDLVWLESNQPMMVKDVHGVGWDFVKVDGVLHKRRFNALSWSEVGDSEPMDFFGGE